MDRSVAPEVSVIIRTFNEERRIAALFDGLQAQLFRSFETIIVDSGSFDRTLHIARSHADRVVQIRAEDFTFGHSLNEGIRHARGRLIALVSAHTAPMSERWLDRLIAPFEDETVAMAYGKQCGTVEDSKFGEFMDFGRIFGSEHKVLRPPRFFANNANAAIVRELWAQRHFDEALPGLEDADWAKYWMGRGFQVVYTPEAGVYHYHQESWPQVRHRYFREGEAARRIGVRHRRQLPLEIARETAWLGADLVEAGRRGLLWTKANEIVRFRYEKVAGACAGVWSGTANEGKEGHRDMNFATTHRAAVIHGPGHAEITDVETPNVKPSEVLIRIAYVGVCATDLEILDGELGYYKSGEASYPIVPGHESSGTVAQIGARVVGLKPGDRVVVECIQGCGSCLECERKNWIACSQRREVGVIGTDGACQQYMLTPARFVHVIPDGVSLLSACVCEPLAVVLKGLRRLEKVIGAGPHHIAVMGAGPIGHLAARILTLRGHVVTVFDRRPDRRAYLDDLNIAVESEPSGLSRFHALIEATGDASALEDLLEQSMPGAALLLLGLPYSRRLFSFESVVGYDKVIVGSVGSASEDFEEAAAILSKIDTRSFFQRILPFEQVQSAWDLTRQRSFLKVVLQVDPEAN